MKSAEAGATTIASAPRDSVDVAHRVGGAGLPQVGQHRTAGERLERHRRDELRRRVGHHDVDGDAFLDQQARQFRRLVRGDAAGDAQHDALQGAGGNA